MTRAEADLFRKLVLAFGGEYVIVPQVHLSALFSEKVKGQNWKAAFSHINGKSVDFVLLDRRTLEIVCAIECDDITHTRSDRVARDVEVNNIFKNAGLPLVRLNNTLRKSYTQIKREISVVI